MQRDFEFGKVVDLRQELAEENIRNRGKFRLSGKAAEDFHSRLGFLPSNFSRFSNLAIRSRKKRCARP